MKTRPIIDSVRLSMAYSSHILCHEQGDSPRPSVASTAFSLVPVFLVLSWTLNKLDASVLAKVRD